MIEDAHEDYNKLGYIISYAEFMQWMKGCPA